MWSTNDEEDDRKRYVIDGLGVFLDNAQLALVSRKLAISKSLKCNVTKQQALLAHHLATPASLARHLATQAEF